MAGPPTSTVRRCGAAPAVLVPRAACRPASKQSIAPNAERVLLTDAVLLMERRGQLLGAAGHAAGGGLAALAPLALKQLLLVQRGARRRVGCALVLHICAGATAAGQGGGWVDGAGGQCGGGRGGARCHGCGNTAPAARSPSPDGPRERLADAGAARGPMAACRSHTTPAPQAQLHKLPTLVAGAEEGVASTLPNGPCRDKLVWYARAGGAAPGPGGGRGPPGPCWDPCIGSACCQASGVPSWSLGQGRTCGHSPHRHRRHSAAASTLPGEVLAAAL